MAADRDQFGPPASSRERIVRPYETPQFRHSVEYTIAVTFVVAGGARWQTAMRRARRIAEMLANTAARAKGVVDVRAVAGPSRKGEVSSPERVCFAAANAGRATNADPTKLDRYLDPDHQLALAALTEDQAAARAHVRADQQRREAVGCANPWRTPFSGRPGCVCVYCQPAVHLDALAPSRRPDDLRSGRCVCGRQTAAASACASHRDHRLVLLDGDPPELERLAAIRPRHPPPPWSGPEARDRPEGPGLPPPER